MRYSRLTFATSALAALSLLGCAAEDANPEGRPKTVPAGGTVTHGGQPVEGAIVELAARRADETTEFVATNAKGVATFFGLPAGTLQLNVFADGFADARVQVTEDARRATAITLTRR